MPVQKKTHRLSERLLLLNDAILHLNSFSNRNEFLETACSEFVSIFSADGCALSLWEPEQNRLVTIADYWGKTPDTNYDDHIYFDLTDYPLSKKVLEEETLVHISATDPDVDRKELVLLEAFEANSLLMMPLILKDQVIGLIELYYNTDIETYSTDDITLARVFSNHVGSNLRIMELMTDLKKQASINHMLHESAIALASSLDAPEILFSLAEQLCRMVNATSAYINLVDLDKKTYSVTTEYFSEAANELERVSDMGVAYPYEEAIFQKIIVGEPIIYTKDTDTISDFKQEHLTEYGGYAVFEIPVPVDGKTAALIEIWDSRAGRTFTEHDIELGQIVALQASISLEKSKLYENATNEIRARKAVEQRLAREANHDSLTNLPNRRYFGKALNASIERKKTDPDYSFAVLYIDLDQFKAINDSFGHSVGDYALLKMSESLQQAVAGAGFASRFGGDEFLVLLDAPKNMDVIMAIAQSILTNIEKPFIVHGKKINLSASIGIALCDKAKSEVHDVETYIHQADVAAYGAKATGKNRYLIYTDSFGDLHSQSLKNAAEITAGFENNEFELFFQPIIELSNGKLWGFEALLRWVREDGEIRYPDSFMSALYHARRVEKVTAHAFRQVADFLNGIRKTYPDILETIHVSMNISYPQIVHPGFIESALNILEENQIPPQGLSFEITEDVLIEQTQDVNDILLALRENGFNIYLDDFGTGFSKLQHLHEFPINCIKVDKVFVDALETDEKQNVITQSIIMLGKSLQCTVIAEGIETAAQIQVLQKLGCELGQGFYFSEGIPAPAALAFMKGRVG